MLKTIHITFAALLIVLSFAGCAKPALTGQTAEYYYRQMAWEISRNNLEPAGNYYSSLASEHIASALLKEAALLMANAHSANEEYLLANFYLDEYLKRYGDRENNDWINYLKLYADYRGFKQPLRNQKLLLDSIVRCEDYVARFGESELEIFVQTLMTKLRLANAELSGNISSLYRRLDKDDAAALYAKKGEFAPIDEGEYKGARRLWIRQIFE